MLQVLAKIRSLYLGLTLILVDIIPGRSDRVRGMATRAGIPAHAVVSNMEWLDTGTLLSTDVLWFHVDRGGPTAKVLARMADAPRALQAYLFARDAFGDLWAFAFAITAGDSYNAVRGAKLLGAIDQNTRPSGYNDVFGHRYAAQGATLEQIGRANFRSYALSTFAPLACGSPTLSRYPIEASWNGGAMMPVVVIDRTLGWATPDQLISQVAAEAAFEALPGSEFVIAELGPRGAIKLHRVRLAASPSGDPEEAVRNAAVTAVNAMLPIDTTD